MPEAGAIVFVVDDDVSVRESLEGLIRSTGLGRNFRLGRRVTIFRDPPCGYLLLTRYRERLAGQPDRHRHNPLGSNQMVVKPRFSKLECGLHSAQRALRLSTPC